MAHGQFDLKPITMTKTKSNEFCDLKSGGKT